MPAHVMTEKKRGLTGDFLCDAMRQWIQTSDRLTIFLIAESKKTNRNLTAHPASAQCDGPAARGERASRRFSSSPALPLFPSGPSLPIRGLFVLIKPRCSFGPRGGHPSGRSPGEPLPVHILYFTSLSPGYPSSIFVAPIASFFSLLRTKTRMTMLLL